MCPTHILVHRTPPLRGVFTVLGQGGYNCFQGVNIPLRGGYINPWQYGRRNTNLQCVRPYLVHVALVMLLVIERWTKIFRRSLIVTKDMRENMRVCVLFC